MYIPTVTYESYDDEPEMVTEKLCFHISKREWMEMLIADEPMSIVIQKIIDSKSNQQIVDYLKEIVLKAYGIREVDPKTGKMTKFRKSPEISREFEDSAAFNALLEDLLLDDSTDKIARFITGIFPKEVTSTPEYSKMVAEAKAEAAAAKVNASAETPVAASTQTT